MRYEIPTLEKYSFLATTALRRDAAFNFDNLMCMLFDKNSKLRVSFYSEVLECNIFSHEKIFKLPKVYVQVERDTLLWQ